MNLKDYYWYFDSVLPHKFCDELIKYGNTKKEELGLIGEISEKNASGKSLEDRDFQDLKNINLINIMIGTVIAGKNLMQMIMAILIIEIKLENYL